VLALAPDYRWVLVGEPGRRFGSLLSGTPTLSTAEQEATLTLAEALGYQRSAFKLTPQPRLLP